MKTLTTIMLAALLGLLASAPAHAGPPKTYESVVRVTLPIVDASSITYAFQNTSTGESVRVHRIEVSHASTQTVAGALAQYYIFTSTQITHSAAITSAFRNDIALGSQPSGISVSSAPRNVLAEGDTTSQFSSHSSSGAPAFLRPLYVNNDEAAAANLYDAWSENEHLGPAAYRDGPQPFILPAGASRGFVIQYKRHGATDAVGGSLYIRVIYTTF